MASEFLIPHPNIPTADIGLPKLKEVTVKNNENFLALDRLLQEFSSGMSSLDRKIEAQKHDHPYAPLVHEHQLTDVVGLVPALEQKAPLVHEHPQYLTSVPEHNHTIYNVNGLVEALADKANAQHAHNMDEVNGLLNALAAKADNGRVDWIENNMAKLTQSETPLADGDPQSGAGVIGTSDKAARADHRHPVNKTSDVNNIKSDGNGTGGTPQIGTLHSYALTDHSHPLNYPDGKPTNVLAPDGNGTGDTPQFGDSNYYADLYHSHPLNVGTSGAPADVVKSSETASLGSSGYYARQDHVHKMPELVASDVKYGTDSTVGATLDDHEGRISDLEDGTSGAIKAGDDVSLLNNDANYQNATQVGAKVAEEIGKLDKWPGFGTTHDKAAYGDHSHGNITSDGKMTVGGGVVTVDLTGAVNTGSSLVLSKLVSTQGAFNYDQQDNTTLEASRWVKTDANKRLVTISDDDAPASKSSVESVRTLAQGAQATADAASAAASVADGKAVAADTKATNAQSTANTANGKADTNAQNITALDGRLTTAEGSLSSLSTTVGEHSTTLASHESELETHQSALENIVDVLIAGLDERVDAAQAKADEAMTEAESKVDETQAGTIADGRIDDWEQRFGPVAEDDLDSKNTSLGYIKDESGNEHLVRSDILGSDGKIKSSLVPSDVLTEGDIDTEVASVSSLSALSTRVGTAETTIAGHTTSIGTLTAGVSSAQASAAQAISDAAAAQATANSKITSTQADSQIDTKIAALNLSSTYAAKEHQHEVADITDLDAVYKAAFTDGRQGQTNGPVFFNGTGLAAADKMAASVVSVQNGQSSIGLDAFFSGANIDGTKVGNLTANRWVKTDASGKLSTPQDEQPVVSDGTEAGGDVPMFDEDGVLTPSGITIPTTAPDKDKFLAHKTDGSFDWLEAMAADDTLPTAVLHGADISVDVAGQTYLNQAAAEAVIAALRGTWTRGGTTPAGTKLTVCTGITKNGANSTYYAHFADMYFDKNGCLAKVETARNWYRVI